MDIHKPKPWHGLREFLKEYLIIVAGVLTALGGEQVVETMHRQQELTETREALQTEIANNARAVQVGAAKDQCGAGRIALLQAWAEGGPKPQPGPTSGVTVLAFSAWDVAKAGPMAKMPVAERLKYSTLYDSFATMQANMQNQINEGLELAQFTPLAKLSPDQGRRMVERINRYRVTLAIKAIVADDILGKVKAVGVRPAPISEGGRQALDALCRSAGTPTPKL